MIKGICDIAKNYDCFVFDLWGVFYEGGPIYSDALEVLEQLHSQNKPIVFASNTPLSRIDCKKKLEKEGLPANLYKDVLTAGDLCIEYIHSKYLNPQQFYVIGNDSWDAWEKINRFHNTTIDIKEADAILCLEVPNTLVIQNDVVKYFDDLFQKAIKRGLKFICANPDLCVPISGKLYLRPGALSLRYQQLGGEVIGFGKPYSEIFIQALSILGHPDRVLMVGDTEYIDIYGAQKHNMDTLLITNSYGENQVLTSKATYFSKTLKW